jgi:predicted nucleotidyltransferase
VIKIESAIETLVKNNVEFVIVGGIAITAHGSAYITKDLDFCYSRNKENLKKIVSALAPFKPRPRGFPENLPYIFDETTLQNATNFTFETELGDIDLLGEVAGIGTFNEVKELSKLMDLYDYKVKVLSIEGLILTKRAAGRPKDLLVLPELEAMQETLLKQLDED